MKRQCPSAHGDQAACQRARACASNSFLYAASPLTIFGRFYRNFGEGFWNTPSDAGGARSWGRREVVSQVKWRTRCPATSAMRCRPCPLPALGSDPPRHSDLLKLLFRKNGSVRRSHFSKPPSPACIVAIWISRGKEGALYPGLSLK